MSSGTGQQRPGPLTRMLPRRGVHARASHRAVAAPLAEQLLHILMGQVSVAAAGLLGQVCKKGRSVRASIQQPLAQLC